MSQFTEKQLVEEGWVETRDEQGRRKFIHPNIVRSGGRKLGVFASDVRGDDGSLQLMGRYLVPLPSLVIKDEEIVEIKRVWVTKNQCKRILRQMGQDYRDVLKSDLGSMLISFAAKAAQAILKSGNIVLNPLQELVFDGAFRFLSDQAFKEVKSSADFGLEDLADRIEKLSRKLISETSPLLKEVVGDAIDLDGLVTVAISPILKELRELFD